jgi:hypothetical protein
MEGLLRLIFQGYAGGCWNYPSVYAADLRVSFPVTRIGDPGKHKLIDT